MPIVSVATFVWVQLQIMFAIDSNQIDTKGRAKPTKAEQFKLPPTADKGTQWISFADSLPAIYFFKGTVSNRSITPPLLILV